MIKSSSLMSRTILKMLKPLSRATRPKTPKTKIAHVPQNVTISSPRLCSDAPPNCATVNAMPPNAPSGAAHMIRRMIPKTTREATSKTRTICSRWTRGIIETAAAVKIARTSTWRISLSTNGCRKLVGRRWPVMNGTMPESWPASEIDSFAAARPAALTEPSKPEPGCTMFAASRPSVSATTVAQKKYASALRASPPARARLPSDAMPITTVTKITGAVTVLMSWMKASASHFAFLALSGATRPKTTPAAIATSTQNQSWVASRRWRGLVPSGAAAAVADIEALPSREAHPPPERGGLSRIYLPRSARFGAWLLLQPAPGDVDRVRALVDEHEPPPELRRHRPERPGAGEEVQAPAARPRRRGHHAAHDPLGLLRRVARALGAVRRDDGVPPGVRRALAPRALLGRHEARSHVRLAVDLGVVEVVASRVAHVD